MEIPARQLLLAVLGIVIATGCADAVQGETATSAVVGLAKCSDCARRNMNAEAAFKGLQVAVKCKNSKGEYESTAVGRVDKSGAFSVPLAADVVGEDGGLKLECFAQLHSASSAPCPGQEPSKIVVAAPPGVHGGNDKTTTFVALGGKVYRSSPECASAFISHPFFHSVVHNHHGGTTHTPVVTPHLSDHGHGHSVPPVTKPPAVHDPEHKPVPVPVPEQKPPSTPVDTPPSTPTSPSTPVYSSPKPTPIYHPPAQRDAVTAP